MNDNLLEKGLRMGIEEMDEGMKRVLGKVERSRDVSHEDVKSTVLKGLKGMAMVMEKAVKGIGERLAEEVRVKDRVERELEDRIKWLEDLVGIQRRDKEKEEKGREERLQSLEQRMRERDEEDRRRKESMDILEQKVKEGEEGEKVRAEALQRNITVLVGRIDTLSKGKESLEEREREQEEERNDKERIADERMTGLEEGLRGLEKEVRGREVSTDGKKSMDQISERMQKLEEKERMAEEERAAKELAIGEKVRTMEERLEKEKKDRERCENERKEDLQMRERMASVKEMEQKVDESLESLKILNLRFGKVSKEKGALLNEAEDIIKGKVGVKDRIECEGILRRSRVYILGTGTEDKIVNGKRICTAPVLVKCGSQTERKRLERMIKNAGMGAAFHWPKELMDFVYDIRSKVEQMGYKKDEYYVKVRPFIMDGVPQLRAEVKKKDEGGSSFERVGCWPCPPADRTLW